MYPKLLEPKLVENICLPSGETIGIPKSSPCFKKWSDASPADTYGGKTILNFKGEPVFAKFAILRIFRDDGWDGVRVDTDEYGKVFRIVNDDLLRAK